jgi:hypothetical protein
MKSTYGFYSAPFNVTALINRNGWLSVLKITSDSVSRKNNFTAETETGVLTVNRVR